MILAETINSSLIRRLEDIEAAVWGEFFRSPGADTAERLGLRLINAGGGTITITSGQDILALNRTLNFGVEGKVDAEDIEWLKEQYKRLNVPRFFVTVTPDTPQEVVSLLEEAGFYHYNNWAKLYRDNSPLDSIESDLTVREIDIKYAKEFARIFPGCIDWGEDAVDWMKSLVGRSNWHHYLAFDGDILAAGASLYVRDRTAWIGFAGTYPEFRGKGAQAALSQRRIADALQLGAELIVVETAVETPEHPAPSYRNMLRYGFSEAYRRKNYIFEFEK